MSSPREALAAALAEGRRRSRTRKAPRGPRGSPGPGASRAPARGLARLPIAPLDPTEARSCARRDVWRLASEVVQRSSALLEGAAEPEYRAELERLAEAARALLSIEDVVPGRRVVRTEPFHTESESNRRDTVFRGRAALARAHRRDIPDVLRARVGIPAPRQVTHVHLVRRAHGRLDPGNLESAFKSVQDAVAGGYLGMDDADPRVTFSYDQERIQQREPEGVTFDIAWDFGP